MVFISAGHSNLDPGAIANGVKESEIVTEARNIIRHKLEAAGIQVTTDGAGDTNLPLSEAVKLVAGKTLAIELHCNAALSAQAGGVESISLPKLKTQSQRISQAISRVTGSKLRGAAGWIDQSKSQHTRLAFVNAGGIIVELFFLSNPSELKVWQEKKWLVCQSIVDEIIKIINE